MSFKDVALKASEPKLRRWQRLQAWVDALPDKEEREHALGLLRNNPPCGQDNLARIFREEGFPEVSKEWISEWRKHNDVQ